MKTMPGLDLVFLAACHSERIGEVFVNSGVKHVICIKQQQEVLDEAALTFTKFFYKALMNRTTVCDAFIQAKSQVELEYKKKESDMFTLLPKQNTHTQCTTIDKIYDGEMQCASNHVQIKSMPRMTQTLRYREK